MNLRQIELLRAVIRCETTVRAAQEIGLSQPAVSNGIKHMESQLGFALFERVNNRLYPTHEAQNLYEATEPLFHMYETFSEQVRDMKSNRMQSLRILASPPLGYSVIPAALRRFTERRRGVTVHFDIQDFDRIAKCVEVGAVDLAFVIGTDNIRDHDSEVFYSEPLVCVMPADHPLTRLDVIQPEDLVGHAFVSLQPSTSTGRLQRSLFAEAGIKFEFRVEVRYSNTACSLVRNRVGVSLVDPFLAMQNVDDTLVIRPFLPERMITAAAIWSPKRLLPTVASDFLRDVRTVARQFVFHPPAQTDSQTTAATVEDAPAE